MSATIRRGFLLLTVILAACASSTATRYETMVSGKFLTNTFDGSYEGFEIEMLGADLWRVTFEGNSATTEDTAQTFGLYRCSVVALEHGYDGFEILSDTRLDIPSTAPYPRTSSAGTSGGAAVGGAVGGVAGALVGAAINSSAGTPYPVFSSDIRLVKKPLNGRPPKMFDAVVLKSTLEPYVVGKKCDNGNVCPHDHSYLRADGDTTNR